MAADKNSSNRMNGLNVGYGITPKELGNNWRGLLLKNTIEYNVINYLKLFLSVAEIAPDDRL